MGWKGTRSHWSRDQMVALGQTGPVSKRHSLLAPKRTPYSPCASEDRLWAGQVVVKGAGRLDLAAADARDIWDRERSPLLMNGSARWSQNWLQPKPSQLRWQSLSVSPSDADHKLAAASLLLTEVMDRKLARASLRCIMLSHHDALSWFIMLNHDDSSRWIMMIHRDESWCFIMMNHDDSWWFIMMNHDDSSWWIMMIHHDVP